MTEANFTGWDRGVMGFWYDGIVLWYWIGERADLIEKIQSRIPSTIYSQTHFILDFYSEMMSLDSYIKFANKVSQSTFIILDVSCDIESTFSQHAPLLSRANLLTRSAQ